MAESPAMSCWRLHRKSRNRKFDKLRASAPAAAQTLSSGSQGRK